MISKYDKIQAIYIYIYIHHSFPFSKIILKKEFSFSIKYKYFIVFQWQSDAIRSGENTFKIFKKQSKKKKKKQYPSKSKSWRIIEKISETIKSY